jgi:hypothetical protein
MKIVPKRHIGPLFTETQFKDVKDPCVLFDGTQWHIYGSGGDVRSEKWSILHARADSIEGPWQEIEPVVMIGLQGDHVAAPSVWYEKGDCLYHMMVQTEFTSMGGNVEYLTSSDGKSFTHAGTVIAAVSGTGEAGIYDPHQAVIYDKKYIVYAGTPAIEGFNNSYIIQPDIYLAESADSWAGPWQRLGKILDHDHIDWHHNSRHHREYEWGIEGPQLVPLPNGKILLNATCFLTEGEFGTRQRVFFAISDSLTGPYESIGPVLAPDEEAESWQSGENGHATAIVHENELYLFYQARSRNIPGAANNNWRYGIAVFSLEDL